MRLDDTARDTKPRDKALLEALSRPSGWVLTIQISDRAEKDKVDTWQIPLPEWLTGPSRPGAEAMVISGLGQWLAELAATLKRRATTAGAISIDVRRAAADDDEGSEVSEEPPYEVGDLVEVEWCPDPDIEPGTFEGRVVNVRGRFMTVHFEYTDGTPAEDIQLNLDEMFGDLTNHKRLARVAPIRQGRRRRSR